MGLLLWHHEARRASAGIDHLLPWTDKDGEKEQLETLLRDATWDETGTQGIIG